MLHPASYIPTAPLFSLNLRLLWLFRFEERRELRNISLECFSKGRGIGFGDFGMELKNLGSGAMTLTGQMGLSECNELPICPVVFSHLSDPLVFLTPWSGAKDNAPPLWIRLYKLYSAVLERFSCSEESDKLRFPSSKILYPINQEWRNRHCNHREYNPRNRNIAQRQPQHNQICE